MIRIHPTAEVSEKAIIGEGTSIWHHCQIRSGAIVGTNCILGKGVYVDDNVKIGKNVKIQNYVSVYHGVEVENGVFIGPHVCFTNDLHPRAINPDGTLKSADDWVMSRTLIQHGAALGANSTIRCGVTIGMWAMVGAGSVVTSDVPQYALVYGNPARIKGFVCPCGYRLQKQQIKGDVVFVICEQCGQTMQIPLDDWQRIK
jgi:UDP-2-acetamido-3-amino-2,3-dideoxy-glucuronate N-acetyltransferase